MENLSSEPDSAYFSDGMTDEITTKLAKIQGIDVAPHSSAAALKTADKSAAEIGKALGVRYLLEGSVRKAGDQVRINVHLIDSSTGFQVWAYDFTGEMKDVFWLQEQSALKIAQFAQPQAHSPGARGDSAPLTRRIPQAYDAYLRGQGGNQASKMCSKNWKKLAVSMTTRYSSDPNYVPALAGLAWVEGQTYRNIDGSLPICNELSNLRSALSRSSHDYPKLTWRSGTVDARQVRLCQRVPARVSHGYGFSPGQRLCLGSPVLVVLAYEQPPEAAAFGKGRARGPASGAHILQTRTTTLVAR